MESPDGTDLTSALPDGSGPYYSCWKDAAAAADYLPALIIFCFSKI